MSDEGQAECDLRLEIKRASTAAGSRIERPETPEQATREQSVDDQDPRLAADLRQLESRSQSRVDPGWPPADLIPSRG